MVDVSGEPARADPWWPSDDPPPVDGDGGPEADAWLRRHFPPRSVRWPDFVARAERLLGLAGSTQWRRNLISQVCSFGSVRVTWDPTIKPIIARWIDRWQAEEDSHWPHATLAMLHQHADPPDPEASRACLRDSYAAAASEGGWALKHAFESAWSHVLCFEDWDFLAEMIARTRAEPDCLKILGWTCEFHRLLDKLPSNALGDDDRRLIEAAVEDWRARRSLMGPRSDA